MKTLFYGLFLAMVGTAVTSSAQAPMPNVPPKTTVAHSLAWDASTTPNVVYVVRRGVASGKYDEMVVLPGLAYVWTNAPAAATNYYVVSSRDSTGLESVYSNERSVEPRARPDAPGLMTAVPITVWIERKESDGQWVKVATVGQFYDLAQNSQKQYRPGIMIGPPSKVLP